MGFRSQNQGSSWLCSCRKMQDRICPPGSFRLVTGWLCSYRTEVSTPTDACFKRPPAFSSQASPRAPFPSSFLSTVLSLDFGGCISSWLLCAPARLLTALVTIVGPPRLLKIISLFCCQLTRSHNSICKVPSLPGRTYECLHNKGKAILWGRGRALEFGLHSTEEGERDWRLLS